MVNSNSVDSTALPRILCLHGGGSNARIFKAQTRAIRHALSSSFRFVFADAPFDSEPGPDVTTAYANFAPFRRWLRSAQHHPHIAHEDALQEIHNALNDAMKRDDLLGGRGRFVAVLGFSQGAKMAASLLLHQQMQSIRPRQVQRDTEFEFAILLNGRGPLVSLNWETKICPTLVDTSEIYRDVAPSLTQEHLLYLPTIHVHGLLDPGLHLHRKLLYEHCAQNSARVIEWQGAHRVPIRTNDVTLVAKEILFVANMIREN